MYKYLSERLFPYNIDDFSKRIHILNNEETVFSKLKNKFHVSYLDKYLDKIGVNFFLIEDEYVNKDYITNFSSYYSTCFSDYKKKSSRVHFFKIDNKENLDNESLLDFVKNTLSQILIPNNENQISKREVNLFFQKNYVGYVVINPIPNTFLGYTLLKHHNHFESKKDRFFWGTRDYNAHFFGIDISINSLAFHEQDSNVGACATAAIWSVFQKAAENYYVNLKSPIEITKDAGVTNYNGQRMLPNDGLIPEAICAALSKNNLEPELRVLTESSHPQDYFKRLVYAYSTLGVPVILVVKVPSDGEFYGHAVTICGHRIGKFNFSKTKISSNNFVSKADFISQVYYHDDQWGPFVTATFPKDEDDEIIHTDVYNIQNEEGYYNSKERFLDSTWTELTNNEQYLTAYTLTDKKLSDLIQKGYKKIFSTIELAIVPVFSKVRISYDLIEKEVIAIQDLLYHQILEFDDDASWDFSNWDIQLRYSDDFKEDIRNLNFLGFDNDEVSRIKFQLLSQSFPKYIWIATLCFEEKSYISFIFDATGLVNSQLLLHVFFHVPSLKEEMKERLEKVNYDFINISDYAKVYNELILGDSKNSNFFI